MQISETIEAAMTKSGVPRLTCMQKFYYKFTGNECVAGKSYVINAAGRVYLYMGDDLRKNPAQQIIVVEKGGGDLHFLGIDSKKEIEIVNGY